MSCALMWMLTWFIVVNTRTTKMVDYISKSKYDSHVTIQESKAKKHNANHTNSMQFFLHKHTKQITTKHQCFQIWKHQKWFDITQVEMTSHTLNI
jgi:hypothetical protein